MDFSKDTASIRALAKRLSAYESSSPTHLSLLGFMAGALHSLERAAALRYDDARARPDIAEFAPEFRETLAAIASDTAPPQSWLSGYYFISALWRLAALNERIDTALGTSADVAPSIRRLVNSLKHQPDAHLGPGRHFTVSFSDVVDAATALTGRLETLLASRTGTI